MRTIGVAVCGLAGANPAGAQMTFQGIGFLSPGAGSEATGVSADGSVLVGFAPGDDGVNHPFTWTKAGGMRQVPFEGIAWAISGDGKVIGGMSVDGPTLEAFVWSEDAGYTGLGTLPGFDSYSYSMALSHDGAVSVGISKGKNSEQGFRWSSADGLTGLGDLPGGGFLSRGYGISADAQVIVGQSQVGPSSFEAFRWTEKEGMVGLGSLNGQYPTSDATDTSADGSVIIGTTGTPTGQAGYRWTSEGGMVSLAGPDGPNSSYANAVSADGSIIVGGYWAPEIRYFVWDEKHGMRDLQGLLETQLDLGGWTRLMPWDISADGLTIVGEGTNPEGITEGWIATIPAPPAGLLLGALGVVAAARRRAKP
jgi:probable HAF family extracellular repeat protein